MRSLSQLFEFDWLASLISLYLPLLCQFNYHLPAFRAKKVNKLVDESTFSRLRQRFEMMHKKHYKSRLIIDKGDLQCCSSTDSSDTSD